MALLPYGICEGRVLIITPQLVIKDNVIGSLDPNYPNNFWLSQNVFTHFNELPCLIEFEGRETKDEWLYMSNVVVVNIQKMQSRLTSSLINRVPPDFFDMIIIDEAHHSTANTWLETLQYFSRAKVIKLTGTPWRSDKEKIKGEIVFEYKLSEAMAQGYVKSLENFTYVPDKLYLTLDGDDSKLFSVEQILEMGLRDEDWVSRTVAFSTACSEKVVLESIRKLNAKKESSTVPHKIIAVACFSSSFCLSSINFVFKKVSLFILPIPCSVASPTPLSIVRPVSRSVPSSSSFKSKLVRYFIISASWISFL